MQFDPVGRDPDLAMGPVEEPDAAERRATGEPFELDRRRGAARSDERSASLPHLESDPRGGASGACRLRELDDHRPCESPRVCDHEMDVVVALKHRANECRAHNIGRRFDTPDARHVMQVGRKAKTAKRTDGGRAGRHVDQPRCGICQRLDGPAPLPARRFGRGRSWRYSCGSGHVPLRSGAGGGRGEQERPNSHHS